MLAITNDYKTLIRLYKKYYVEMCKKHGLKPKQTHEQLNKCLNELHQCVIDENLTEKYNLELFKPASESWVKKYYYE